MPPGWLVVTFFMDLQVFWTKTRRPWDQIMCTFWKEAGGRAARSWKTGRARSFPTLENRVKFQYKYENYKKNKNNKKLKKPWISGHFFGPPKCNSVIPILSKISFLIRSENSDKCNTNTKKVKKQKHKKKLKKPYGLGIFFVVGCVCTFCLFFFFAKLENGAKTQYKFDLAQKIKNTKKTKKTLRVGHFFCSACVYACVCVYACMCVPDATSS